MSALHRNCAFVACALLGIILPLVAGIQIQSTFVEKFIRASLETGNDTEWQQNTLTFACFDSDFSVINLQIGNVYYDITCRAPIVPYEVIHRGFVPRKQRLYKGEVCIVDNSARINVSQSTLQKGQVSSRRL